MFKRAGHIRTRRNDASALLVARRRHLAEDRLGAANSMTLAHRMGPHAQQCIDTGSRRAHSQANTEAAQSAPSEHTASN